MLTNEDEVNRIISLYGNQILRMSYLMLNDYDLAQDVVQDTLIKVIKKYSTLQNKENEKTWIMRIAINQCKNQLRGQWIKKIILYEDETKYDKRTIELEVNEDDNILESILSLNDKYKEVILLYYYQELSIKEIASALGKKESNIQQLLKRARQQLKERMEKNSERNKKGN